jgi:bisphosphoglycerate-independent phosphoglycerate mutase (AlkP superfamily)
MPHDPRSSSERSLSLRTHDQLSDVGSTCLEIMGLSTPDRMTGVSLLPGHHNVYTE